MSNDTKTESVSEKTGSSDEIIAGPINKGDLGVGQPAVNNQAPKAEDTVPKAQYEELSQKLGTQGNELGEYRDFFKQISPLLDKLDRQPELVQAIIDGKIDSVLAKAALEGKVSVKEAETVSKAHEEVKKEVGEKKYDQMKPEEIEALVSKKAEEMLSSMEQRLKKNIDEVEEIRNFEKRVDDFISKTDDFPEYANKINDWFDEHPDQDNIEIAYNAVKGMVLQQKAKELQQKESGEAAKQAAADAGGGASQSSSVVSDRNLVDQLIAGKQNPNIF